MLIYLIGPMGSGKTALGKKLARYLNMPFYDLDMLFENKYKISIQDFFEKYGEEKFRDLEQKTLQSTFLLETAVIATGGGTPCHFDNMEQMNRHGCSVYLKIPLGHMIVRLKHSKKPRPLLKAIDQEAIPAFLGKLLSEREAFYNAAQIIVDEDPVDLQGLAHRICNAIK